MKFKNKPKSKKFNNVTTIFGNGSTHSVNGPVSIATINQPWGISIHPITQEVYIAEYGGQNIRAWNRASQTVRTVLSGINSPRYLDFMDDGTLFITIIYSGLYKLFINGMYFQRKTLPKNFFSFDFYIFIHILVQEPWKIHTFLVDIKLVQPKMPI